MENTIKWSLIVPAMNCKEIVQEFILDFSSVINKSDQVGKAYLNKAGYFNAFSVNNDLADFHHLSSHFLERYNERYLNNINISKMDILMHFIITNGFGIVAYLESDHIYIKVTAGYVLGVKEHISEIGGNSLDVDIIHYNTFISNDMILDYQRENCNDLTICFNRFFEKYPHEKKIHL